MSFLKKRGRVEEREEEGGRENLRLDGFSPTLLLTPQLLASRIQESSNEYMISRRAAVAQRRRVGIQFD